MDALRHAGRTFGPAGPGFDSGIPFDGGDGSATLPTFLASPEPFILILMLLACGAKA